MCPYYEVPCPLGKCKERMMRKDIPDHLSWKCKYRETTCEFCKHKMALTELQVCVCECVRESVSVSVCVSVCVRERGSVSVCVCVCAGYAEPLDGERSY